MLKLSDRELREFGTRGYVIVRNVIPAANLTAASTEIDCLIRDQPPPVGSVGHHFYWRSTLDGGPLPALFNDTSVRSLAESLIDPGTIEIAFDQVQVALNIPPFSHRLGGHHLDGYLEDQSTPATFTMLAGVLGYWTLNGRPVKEIEDQSMTETHLSNPSEEMLCSKYKITHSIEHNILRPLCTMVC
jgi:hypothetical protein